MASLINSASVLIFLLACVKFASAEVYYIGPTIGGIVGLVSSNDVVLFEQKNNIFIFLRLLLFWI
jgi:hypothetical protein